MTIFSKESLTQRAGDFDPGGADGACHMVVVTRSPKSAYHYRYDGFTFLLRSGGKYFVTGTPVGREDAWDPAQPVLVVPEDSGIRIQVNRGENYAPRPLEATTGAMPAFTC